MSHIFVMGAGGFGTALSVMCARFGHKVTLWSPFREEADALGEKRENPRLLPGVVIDKRIEITTGLEAVPSADMLLLATPSGVVRATAQRIAGLVGRGVPVACVSKGLEAGTFKTLSQVLEEELPHNHSVALSGPSHAEEVARGVATKVVAASRSRDAAEQVQDILMNETFRIYVGDDVLGVELGGAMKNVIALAAGVLDGLGGGDNTKAALMTRGVAEIARLGLALGAKSETFAGLSGIGDLIVTCNSMHSRNRRFGMLIGQGVPVDEALEQIGMTVEGYPCAKTGHELSQKHRIDMPITAEVYNVLYEGKSPADVIKDLMERPRRHESETIWLLSR